VRIHELENSLFDMTMYLSNEEHSVLEKITGIAPIESYAERDRVIIENLIRKNVVIKVPKNESYVVLRNE